LVPHLAVQTKSVKHISFFTERTSGKSLYSHAFQCAVHSEQLSWPSKYQGSAMGSTEPTAADAIKPKL
jgi:hypothetical protein